MPQRESAESGREPLFVFAPAPPRPFVYRPPPEPGFRVVHADEQFLAIDKDSGLMTVPGKTPDLADCLQSRVAARFPDAGPVHRLDTETSGLVLFARTALARRHMGMQFEKRHIGKRYIARVAGIMGQDEGEISLPLICDWPNRPRQIVCFERGKPSLTRWRVLAREDGSTRLELHPKTGRSHQLRVHLMSIGHPILGDLLYAPDPAYRAADRLQLHAEQLNMRHPIGGAHLTLTAPCPF